MTILDEKKYQDGLSELYKAAKEDEELSKNLEFSDEFLGAFIYGKKGDVKKALKTLKHYVSVRKGKYNEFFKTCLPNRLRYFQEKPKFQAIFKPRDKDGRVIGFFKMSLVNFTDCPIEDVFRGLVLAGEELIRLGQVTKTGVVLIIDLRGMEFHHVRVFTPATIQFVFSIFVGSYPIKYKGFHLLYDSIIVHPPVQAFKFFAPKKIRERVHSHGNDLTSLWKWFDPSILPECLGGQLKPEECYDFELEDSIFGKEDYFAEYAMKW